ncbi:MAG: N-formylglutamate amidohydrolase [Caulobacteraceae bacterium]|nr:N-formylglutamate amidohydrolase [Caulobacter sp.]
MPDQIGHDSPAEPPPLLAAGDPPPADVRRRGAGAPFLFICDHAGRLTPRVLGDMGVSPADWDRHIAWDIGAAALTERLSARFAAPAVLQRYSRLVIDCNRDPAREDAIPRISDGVAIPANAELPPPERRRRVADIHAPYHAAIDDELQARRASGSQTLMVFIHSFTPRLTSRPSERPWRFGVLHHGGSPASHAMLRQLRRAVGDAVGDNEPYAFDEIDYSAPRHAMAQGLDYVELEVRQDLLAGEGAEPVAQLLGDCLASL